MTDDCPVSLLCVDRDWFHWGCIHYRGKRSAKSGKAKDQKKDFYSSDKCRAKVNMAKAEDKETHATN